MSKIDNENFLMHEDWMSFSPTFSNLIPCFCSPTFYLSFFTVVDDKLILGKFILTGNTLRTNRYNPTNLPSFVLSDDSHLQT